MLELLAFYWLVTVVILAAQTHSNQACFTGVLYRMNFYILYDFAR